MRIYIDCHGTVLGNAVLAELAGALRDLAAWWRESGGDRAKAMAKGRMC